MKTAERQLLEARTAALCRVIDQHAEANSLSNEELLTALSVSMATLLLSGYLSGQLDRQGLQEAFTEHVEHVAGTLDRYMAKHPAPPAGTVN